MINPLAPVEVHGEPSITAAVVGRDWGGPWFEQGDGWRWVRPAVALPGQCLETHWEWMLLGLAEIPVPVRHCPSREKFVRQRVAFGLEEAGVVTGPQHGRCSAGIKLGKVANPVGWRLPGKRRCVVQGEEGASEERLRLYPRSGCQNAPQTVANGHVSGAAQDCQMRSYSSLKDTFLRDGASRCGAAKARLLQSSKICLLKEAVLDPDRFPFAPTSFQPGKHHPAHNIWYLFPVSH